MNRPSGVCLFFAPFQIMLLLYSVDLETDVYRSRGPINAKLSANVPHIQEFLSHTKMYLTLSINLLQCSINWVDLSFR